MRRDPELGIGTELHVLARSYCSRHPSIPPRRHAPDLRAARASANVVDPPRDETYLGQLFHQELLAVFSLCHAL